MITTTEHRRVDTTAGQHSATTQGGHGFGPETTMVTNPVAKNVGNRTSLRDAVNAQCANCMGCTAGHREPGFVELVRHCTAPTCPLWHFRPYREKRS